ncbi:sentrin-specific protease 1-like [Ornithodoros turicata]|uniref:sentrin-specific protease 1-like n=1 Tax=Ornithodoros turicata TaxID=34597 RepID=UPI00313A053D
MSDLSLCIHSASFETYTDATLSFTRKARPAWCRCRPESSHSLSDWTEWALNKPYRERVRVLYRTLSIRHARPVEVVDGELRFAGKVHSRMTASVRSVRYAPVRQNGGLVTTSSNANDVRGQKMRSAPRYNATHKTSGGKPGKVGGGTMYSDPIRLDEREEYAKILQKCLEGRVHFTRRTCKLASRLSDEHGPQHAKVDAKRSVVSKEVLDSPHAWSLQKRSCLTSNVQQPPPKVTARQRLSSVQEMKMLESPQWMEDLKQILDVYHKSRVEREKLTGTTRCVRGRLKMPKLSEAMHAEINAALVAFPADEVLVTAFGLTIRRCDMETLSGLNWLNDEVINFYMNLLMQRSQENPKLAKVYAFNTFFYPRLAAGSHKSVQRWTRKVDIFSYDILLVPLHFHAHWCLSSVDLRKGHIAYYDSMGGSSDMDVLETIREYLQEESMEKRKFELDTSQWTMVVMRDIPLQKNGSDCGMFVCQYAECISRGASINFSQQDMPYLRRRMVYEILHKSLLS